MLTQHARIRMQQRGITTEVINLVSTFGQVNYHRGHRVLFLSRKAQQKVNDLDLPRPIKEKAARTYVVMGNDSVITVGIKYRHFKRNRKH